jgi:hypothetical protein
MRCFKYSLYGLLFLTVAQCANRPESAPAVPKTVTGDVRCAGPLCGFDGLCAWDGQRCVATPRGCAHAVSYHPRRRQLAPGGQCQLPAQTSAQCTTQPDAANSVCALLGECGVADGYCAPTQDAHCQQTWACRALGRCHFDPDPRRCIARSAQDCQHSRACAGHSQCVVEDGRCVVGTDADCRRSPRCRKEGLCTAAGNQCIASEAADCQRSLECARSGRCHLKLDPRSNRCVAMRESDCRASFNCKAQGACRLDGEFCVSPQ